MHSVRNARRNVLKLVCASTLAVGLPAFGDRRSAIDFESPLRELEQQSGGRLGVGILNFETGALAGYRLDERFGMCSTFKLLLAAIILNEAQQGTLALDARVTYTVADMVPYAPITEKYVAKGYMTVLELAEAAQTTSDNVAANLLLGLIGGPPGFTQKLREIGDQTTRLDRYEPALNMVPPGELRDTTSPGAMAANIRRIFSGSFLSDANQRVLRTWMTNTSTGLSRLRAGFPAEWAAGDKTGTGIAAGMANKYNDVAVAWPGDGTPDFVVAAYFEAEDEYDTVRDQDVAVLKHVGKIAADVIKALSA